MSYGSFFSVSAAIFSAAFLVLTTISGSGNWSDSSNWVGANVGDDLSEDVLMNNNVGAITILNGETFTIGDYDMGNGNTLTIDDGGRLNVGSMTTNKITTGNNIIFNISGVLEIWGDLIVNNNLTLNTFGTGMVIIHGNIDMGNNAIIDIQGSVQVDGDFIAGTNTMVNVDGSLNIDGDATVGNNSVLTGSGTVDIVGTCTGPATFCESGPLPVELLFFDVEKSAKYILLKWATASEENSDFFIIQRSIDAQEFYPIDSVSAAGFSSSVLNYHYIDHKPISGRSYYRLKSIDFDGYTEFFEIKTVFFEYLDFSISPNPLSTNSLNIWAGISDKQVAVLSLIDSHGKVVIEKILKPGNNDLELKGLNISNGLYVARISHEGGQAFQKLIISK